MYGCCCVACVAEIRLSEGERLPVAGRGAALMVTMVEHVDMSRDYVVTKSIWHLSDAALKSVCE